MSRKVFISVLGTGFYEPVKYGCGDFVCETRFAQLATVNYLVSKEEWSQSDASFYLLTNAANKANWSHDIKERLHKEKGVVSYEGLEKLLEESKFPMTFDTVPIPDGKNEEEMWEIFESLNSKILPNDELYFDLTHSFRYIPMLILVFGNYVKQVKNAKICGITYGNYEGRDKETNIAPITDLMPLVSLQDWTIAANSFIKYGKMDLLSGSIRQYSKKQELQKFASKISEFEQIISTCRGSEIVNGSVVKEINNRFDMLQSSNCPQPILTIVDKLKNCLGEFDEESVGNLKLAIDWCLKYGLIQQAYTLTQESIITILSDKFRVLYDVVRLKCKDDKERKKKFRIFCSSVLGLSEKDIKTPEKWTGDIKDNVSYVLGLLSLKPLEDLRKPYSQIVEYRNQINHAGFIGKVSAATLISNARKTIDECWKIVSEIETLGEPIEKNPIKTYAGLINLSNHPSSLWTGLQLETAQQYGEIIDVPFPNVEASSDTEDLSEVADGLVSKIKETAGDRSYVVHIMGEMTLTYAVVSRLRRDGIECVASTTERIVEDLGNGEKKSVFKFVKFRRYE